MTRAVFIMLALSGAALTTGCSGRAPGTYALPIATVYDRLKDEHFTDLRRNRQCGLVMTFEPFATGGNEIKWTVRSGSRDMVWFHATLTPTSATETQVVIDLQKGDDGKELYDGTFFPPRPAVVQPLRPAVEEAIDAVLTQRAFNGEHLPAADNDRVCDDQRGALEEGRLSSVDDPLGATPTRLPED